MRATHKADSDAKKKSGEKQVISDNSNSSKEYTTTYCEVKLAQASRLLVALIVH